VTEIQQNRWDRLIRRAAGIVGGGSQVNDTLNELFPVIDVERIPGELLALSGWRLGMCSAQLTVSAGETNHHQLFNPLGSQALIVVTRVNFVSRTQTTSFRFSTFLGAQQTLAGNERRRDTRAGTLANLVAQQRTDQNLVSGGLDFRIRTLVDVEGSLTDDNGVAILFPGTGLTCSVEAVAQLTTVSFMWRERIFEPSEIVD